MLAFSRTLAPKTEVLVRFNLPGGGPIEAHGLVVRALHGLEMGILFVDLKNEERRAIAGRIRDVMRSHPGAPERPRPASGS